MKRTVLTASAVVLTGLLGIATSSHGQNQNRSVSIDVAPLTTQVTYSTEGTPPLETFVAYRMSFSNTGGNTITGLSVTFTAVATDPAEVVSLLRPQVDLPAGCTAAPSGASFTCTRAQLRAGEGQEPFVVFLRAPVQIVNGVADTLGEDFLNAKLTAVFKEGTNGNNPVGQPSVVEQNAAEVLLGTSSPSNIKSAVPKLYNGTLKFFTAANTPGLLDDQISTFVTLPSNVPNETTLEIQESALASDNTDCRTTGNFVRCYQADITIPGLDLVSGQYLNFELRIDPAAISSQLKTNKIRVNYDGSDIRPCVVTSESGAAIVTYAKLPCVQSIDYYKNKGVKGWTPELNGVLVVKAISDSNGRWIIN